MPADEIEVRSARDDDRRSLAVLLAAVAEERDGIAAEPPIDVDALAASWKVDGTTVALAHGSIVGEIRVDPSWMGFGEIGMMVAAGWRDRGVGTALVAAGIKWARAHDLHKLALSVFPHNEAAIALYRKFGFVQEGRLVRHVRRADGQFWDLIEMGLLLGDEPAQREMMRRLEADHEWLAQQGVRLSQCGPEPGSDKVRVYLERYGDEARHVLADRYGPGVIVDTESRRWAFGNHVQGLGDAGGTSAADVR